MIVEMEEATHVSARALMSLWLCLDDIPEKLRLALTCQTTQVEDAAYLLLGIFSMSLPVVYGEGDKALGWFFTQLLKSLGNTSILAWTRQSGSFNSYLPANITVFDTLLMTHIPLMLEGAEMNKITAILHTYWLLVVGPGIFSVHRQLSGLWRLGPRRISLDLALCTLFIHGFIFSSTDSLLEV